MTWRQALRGSVPRLGVAEWRALDPFLRWFIAVRGQVLIMTLIAAGLGGLMAYRAGRFELRLFVLCTVGLLLAHATNNLLNDATDYVRGVDKDNYARAQYGPHPLAHQLIDRAGMIRYILCTGLPALAIGIYFTWLRGMPTLWLFGAGIVFVLFYTWPLKYIGMGELAVLAVWGPLMVGGTYFVLTGHWDSSVSIISLPYALGTTSVLFGKHIDKLQADKKKGIRTLPVLLGERPALFGAVLLMFLQYAVVIGLVATKQLGPWVLVALLAGRTFYLVTKALLFTERPTERPSWFPQGVWPLWYVAFAFLHNRTFGLLYILGLTIEAVTRTH